MYFSTENRHSIISSVFVYMDCGGHVTLNVCKKAIFLFTCKVHLTSCFTTSIYSCLTAVNCKSLMLL